MTTGVIHPTFVIPSEASNLLFSGHGHDNLGQLPHPRHERCIPRTLHQKHRMLLASESIVNFPLFLPRYLLRALQFPTRRAEFDHRTRQACRRARRAHRRAQLHHRLIEISGTRAIQQVFLPHSTILRQPASCLKLAATLARHCHRPPRPARRRQCSRSPRTCIARFPAAPVNSSAVAGNFPPSSRTTTLAAACSMRARR